MYQMAKQRISLRRNLSTICIVCFYFLLTIKKYFFLNFMFCAIFLVIFLNYLQRIYIHISFLKTLFFIIFISFSCNYCAINI